MEATQAREQEGDEESQLLVRSAAPRRRVPAAVQWPTIDGPFGLSVDESEQHARRFFWWGLCFLPLLWGINCLYFWPVLRSCQPFASSSSSSPSPSTPHPLEGTRKYVFRSAIGFSIATILLSSWALTFMIGGERLFGPVWKELVTYNVAEKYGLTELM